MTSKDARRLARTAKSSLFGARVMIPRESREMLGGGEGLRDLEEGGRAAVLLVFSSSDVIPACCSACERLIQMYSYTYFIHNMVTVKV